MQKTTAIPKIMPHQAHSDLRLSKSITTVYKTKTPASANVQSRTSGKRMAKTTRFITKAAFEITCKSRFNFMQDVFCAVIRSS